jgi:hypothetical protein
MQFPILEKNAVNALVAHGNDRGIGTSFHDDIIFQSAFMPEIVQVNALVNAFIPQL